MFSGVLVHPKPYLTFGVRISLPTTSVHVHLLSTVVDPVVMRIPFIILYVISLNSPTI